MAIGNPPYQESDGGAGASSKQIYPIFAETLMDNKDISQFVLVIKAAWFASGKNVDNFRDKIVNSRQVRKIKYFQAAEEIFPTVHIQGGVCFLNWDRDFNGSTDYQIANSVTNVDLSEFDIIPDDPSAIPIIKKVLAKKCTMVDTIAWTRKPFGLSTDYFKKNTQDQGGDSIKCYDKGKTVKYVSRKKISKNSDKIDEYKIAIPRVYGLSGRCTLQTHSFFIIEPGAITTESYNVIASYKTKKEVENMLQFFQTKFARFMLGLRKNTQDIPRDKWGWVPIMDSKKTWDDVALYTFFSISKKEQEYIDKKILEWS